MVVLYGTYYIMLNMAFVALYYLFMNFYVYVCKVLLDENVEKVAFGHISPDKEVNPQLAFPPVTYIHTCIHSYVHTFMRLCLLH